MASLRKRGSVWYYRHVDSDGRRVEKRGCADKRATEDMARAAETQTARARAGLVNPRDAAYARHEARPLSEHLAAFRDALADKGGTRSHALVTSHRAGRVLELAKATRISDLSISRAHKALAALRSEGLGQETINHYIRAVKAFSRWLQRDGRSREHALAHMSTTTSHGDIRRRRRALTPDCHQTRKTGS
jgi:hypothetical protein